MRIALSICLFLGLWGNFCLARVQDIDTIQQEVSILKSDTIRAMRLIQSSEELYNKNLKTASKIGQRGLQLSLELNYLPGIKRAYDILKRINRRLGNNEMAMEYTLASMRIAEEEGDSVGICDGYTTLGNIYSGIGNLEESQLNLEKAYDLGKRLKVENFGAIANFLGHSTARLGRYQEAKAYIDEALAHETIYPHDDYTLSYIINNLAEVYLLLENHQESIKLYKRSLSLPESKKSPLGVSYSYVGLAYNYNALKEYDRAIVYLDSSLVLTKKFVLRSQTKKAYEVLTGIFEEQGLYKRAFESYKLYHLYGDSLLNDEKLKTIENLKMFYDTEKLKAESEILKNENEFRERRQIYLVFGGSFVLILLVVLLVGIYIISQQRKKSNLLLSNFNEELKQKVEERTTNLTKANADLIKQNAQLQQFSFIASHNLRSPVARILGLLNVIELSKGDLTQMKHEVALLARSGVELDETIKDMNKIIDIRIGKDRHFEKINLNEMLKKIIGQFDDQIKEAKAKVIVACKIEEDIYNQRAYFESIFTNLLSNAIKYRNPKEPLIVRIDIQLVNGEVAIRFSDNGMGIELDQFRTKIFTPYQRFHLDVEGKGIGLYMIKSQIESMQGSINIESQPKQGTIFIINIPLVGT